jgi:hypothetical protein
MPFITGNPKLELQPDGKNWLVLEPIEYVTDRGEWIDIPAGFKTDLTSNYREGKWTKASILHDWLYSCGRFSKRRSDTIYREAMKSLGVGWWQRNKMIAALDLFGFKAWRHWRKYRRLYG